jgi:hypothetical protein
MRHRTSALIAAGAIIASLAVSLFAGEAAAGQYDRYYARHRPPNPYAPYYYSRWNPYSLYSVYDHLSGGRQLCYLPTEPCDNPHRMHN